MTEQKSVSRESSNANNSKNKIVPGENEYKPDAETLKSVAHMNKEELEKFCIAE